MKKSLFICLSLSLLIFSGCAQKALTQKQRDSIKNVSVSMPKYEKDSYRYIDGSGQSNIQDGVGAAGGFIGSLIGAAIDAGIKSSRKKDFETKYSREIKEINNVKVSDIDIAIKERILDVLNNNDFFSSRLNKKSGNHFDTNIIAYGLVRFYEKNEEIYIGASLDAKVTLINEDNKKLFEKFFITKSWDVFTVDELSKNQKLIDKLYKQVYDDFKIKFDSFIYKLSYEKN